MRSRFIVCRIKTGSHFSRDEIRAAVDEAHSFGLKVSSDAERFYVQWAVENGVDIIEHPLPRTDETIELMAEKGVEAVPTLMIYDIIFKYEGGYYGSTSRRFTFSSRSNMKLARKMKKLLNVEEQPDDKATLLEVPILWEKGAILYEDDKLVNYSLARCLKMRISSELIEMNRIRGIEITHAKDDLTFLIHFS